MVHQGAERAEEIGSVAYRALYENSPDGVLFTVPDGRVLAANPAACHILGRTEAEICSLGRQGLADVTDERWPQVLAERARAGHVRGVARMLRTDGTSIEVEMSARIFRDADGEERTCTIIRDVTERMSMERELRDSRERLAEAERVGQMGSWEWDLAADRVSWSDGLLDIYGITRDEFDPGVATGMDDRVYPEDRRRVSATLQHAIAERSAFTIEYRGVRADGRVRTLRSRGEVVVDDAGAPTRVVGIAQDITDAKLAQQALQSTSSELERRANELQELALRTGAGHEPERHAPLTSRQLEILGLVAEGLTSAEISRRLFVSEATVKWHVKQILAKTRSSNRAEAVARVLGASR
ncbi:MAG TPA: PAS domain S-box protein [Solirubrobacteraceae bacterium]|nr:PAS domain S-box protein [Solirubrobacteraceae bacterium]